VKLLRFYVGYYKVLHDLDIRFGRPTKVGTNPAERYSHSIDFLVGINGTGKSTVLHALAHVLRALERGAPVTFPFELEYELDVVDQLRHIKFSNLLDPYAEGMPETGELKISVDGKDAALSREFLPAKIVAFTTGSEREWRAWHDPEAQGAADQEAVFNLPLKEQALRELPRMEDQAEDFSDFSWHTYEEESNYLFIPSKHLPLITLCGLLTDAARSEGEPRLQEVLRQVNIEKLSGFSLKFRLNEGVTSLSDRRAVLSLAKLATRALQLGSDRMLVFDLAQKGLARQILKQYGEGLNLFILLARMASPIGGESPVLRKVSLFIMRPAGSGREAREAPPLHLFQWLSDGEQSFLGRLCLFSLLGTAQALVMLDEPEVHFNDYWKRQIVRLLDRMLRGCSTHTLITTHSSIALTDVPREDIVILRRDGKYTSDFTHPRMQTFAADPSDILVHVFGAPYATGAYSVEQIKEVINTRRTSKRTSKTQQDALERLSRKIGPGYWSFLVRRKLMAAAEE
jgi:predicted ATPase